MDIYNLMFNYYSGKVPDVVTQKQCFTYVRFINKR